MSHDFQILCVGAAATVDMALLLSLLDRRNWRNVPVPVFSLFVGACLFHVGEFANLLLAETRGEWAEGPQVVAMSVLAAGLLLMPSALLHLVARLWRTGIISRPGMHWHYSATYIPLLAMPWIVHALVIHPGEPFLVRVAPFGTAYTLLTCAVNAIAIVTFLYQRRLGQHGELYRFMTWMAMLLVGLSGLILLSAWYVRGRPTNASSPLVMAAILSPIAPSVLFAYFVIRYRLLQLMLERTLVYGAILLAAVAVHRLVLSDATAELYDRYQIDVGILEGVIVLLLVFAYQPFRQRVSEGLHYLLGRDVADVRDRTRKLAVQLSQRFDSEPQPLVDWFLESICKLFEVKRAAAWLFHPDGSTLICSGDLPGFSLEQSQQLLEVLPAQSFACVQKFGAEQLAAIELLQLARASLAVRVDHAGVSGVLVVGRRSRAREFGEEEINSVLLLAELLAVMLHNRYLQNQKLEAERVAAQHEKLSTLGMLTTCLTHEIKNPLSSIKTIATLMAEQFNEGHPQAEDVRLILAEVDRLSATTGDFLRFARPAQPTSGPTPMYPVVDSVIRVLSSLARSKGVIVETAFRGNLPAVCGDETTLREIFFNLLLNSIEAMDRGNQVLVDVSHCGEFIMIRVCDDGPGLAPDVRERLFDPFVTTKPAGTGLGLYIVRRNVQHLGGQITYESEPGKRTCFCVKLPCCASAT